MSIHSEEKVVLPNSSLSARMALLKSFSGKSDSESVASVIEIMGDSEWQVRKEAVAVLSHVDGKATVTERLIKRIAANDNVGRRNAATDLFVLWGKVSVPPLLVYLKQVNEDTQKVIIDVLGDIRDPRAVPVLLTDILGEGSLEQASPDFADNLRSSALEALGKIRTTEAVEQILSFLPRPNHLIVFSAIKALELIGSPLAVPGLVIIANEKRFKRAALQALGGIADIRALDCLLADFHSESETIRRIALRAVVTLELKQTDDKKDLIHQRVKALYCELDYTFLLSMIDHSDASFKRSAISILGWVSEIRSVPLMIPLLSDYDQEVIMALVAMGPDVLPRLFDLRERGVWEEEKTRQVVAEVWGKIAHPQENNLLLDLLKDVSASVREAAVAALGRIKSAETITPLMALLKDPYPEVQERTIRSLLEMSAELPREHLVDMLRDKSACLRANVAILLGEIGYLPAISDMVFLLKDPDASVRRSAVYALGRFPFQKGVNPILTALGDEDYQVRVAALKALESMEVGSIVGDLTPLVHDESIWVRAALARTIGPVAGEKGLALLLRLSEDVAGVVQIAAIGSLSQRRDEEILPVLLKHLSSEDRDVKKAAVTALGAFGDPSAVENITPFLEDPHWALRATAASAVGNLRSAPAKLVEMADSDEDPLVRDAARQALNYFQSMAS
jgi:HEAT repeat protein